MKKQEIWDTAKQLYRMERSTSGYVTIKTVLTNGEELKVTPRILAEIFMRMEVGGKEELTEEEMCEAIRWANGYQKAVNEETPDKVDVPNGVYLYTNVRAADGTNSQKLLSFPENKPARGVMDVVVVYDGHAFKVAKEDLGEWPLVRDTDKCPEESPFYKTECEGLHDWDFVSATKHIQEIGTDIPLPEGWYIPTLAVLEVMCFMKEEINAALSFVGGKPMPDGIHWSVTESNRSNARFVYFYGGYAYGSSKYYGYVVRPVAAFTFEP